jgi:GH15 family glucan-1,4-alpha-glucosidase
MWELTRECARFTTAAIDPEVGLIHTRNAIHESSALEEGFEVWTNSAAVRGFYDASKIAGVLGQPEQEQAWLGSASRLQGALATELYDQETGTFIKVMRKSGNKVMAPDMSQLAPFYFRIVEDKAVLSRTLEHLKRNLWNERLGGFNRFRDFEVVSDWHWYTGGTSAAWPFFAIWAARFYRELGNAEEEEACLRFIDSAATSDHFLPEKVTTLEGYREWKAMELEFGDRIVNAVTKIENRVHDVITPGNVRWSCPLGWAHAEYILLEKRSKEMEGTREAPLLLGEVLAIVKR